MTDIPLSNFAAGPSSQQPTSHEDNAITDHLDGAVDLGALVTPANVPDAQGDRLAHEIMRVVNVNGLSASESIVGTKVIDVGSIGVLQHNGVIQVAPAGRWRIANPRADWVQVNSLTDNPIVCETLTIVRVQKAEYGLAMDRGRPVLLGEGVHVRNNRLFQHIGFEGVNQKHLHHGTIHILLVPIGEYALVVENNVPKILKQGKYVIDSTFFEVQEFVSVNKDHIRHGSIHIVRVPKGKLGLVTNNNKPQLLPEGTYTFNAQVFAFSGLKDLNEPLIQLGTITRFRVRNGEIGLAWDNNKPVFIEKPDFYEIDSPSFTFVSCVNAAEKMIILGSRKRILVYDGEVGVSYVNGRLDILPPNTHVFDAIERIFAGFLSTKQQAIQLNDGNKFASCDTKDFVEIGVKAAVYYRISDPAKSLLTVGNDDAIKLLIRETSVATLQGIMRSSALNQVAQSKVVEASAEPGAANPTGTGAPMFFDKIHDEFILRLHDNFKRLYGIDISNIRINDIKIMNDELAENISKQAIITAQTETRLANLASQKEIATTEQERDAAVSFIKTNAAAAQLATDTKAKASALLADATAKAQATKIEASGAAEAMLLQAQAEAKAVELKSAAEKKRAVEVSATELGKQLALMSLQSGMVTKSLQGVSKIVYLPPGTNNPIQMFGMPNMGIPAMDGMK
eukprot:TRINITY_DN686_c0_g1_i3.p1 TRINITY_DN686_c0_g1~~TRINITY_DN686_c0_g1_i3.p1  ORF type:complete len:680 (-),score=251.32 TRINITY_DN686_c0_g1_i3:72-2111(-)